MEVPFFSIIVPVYKVQAFLEACLETLVSQTFDNYEVILIDDGSPDDCGAICDAWQKQYPNILRVIHQQNQGHVMARWAGMQQAAGQFFLFVDSDDMLRADALETVYRYIRKYNADMVIYNFSGNTKFLHKEGSDLFEDGTVMNIAQSERFRTYLASTFRLNGLCRKVVSRYLIPWEMDYAAFAYIRYGEDLMISLPMVDKAECVVYCREALYYYRPNPDSITHRYHPSMFRSQRDVLRIQRNYAEKWDATGELVRKCDINGLWHFFDDVLVRIIRSDCSFADKKRYIMEMIEDGDFKRNYAYIKELSSTKAQISLILVKNRIFWPLLLFGEIKNRIALWVKR